MSFLRSCATTCTVQVPLAEMESYNAPGSAFPRKFYVGQLLPFLQNHMPISAGVDQTQVNVAKLRIQVSQEDLDYFKHQYISVRVLYLCVEMTYARVLHVVLKATTFALQFVRGSMPCLRLQVISACYGLTTASLLISFSLQQSQDMQLCCKECLKVVVRCLPSLSLQVQERRN
jgi:hypothetical protein